MTGDRERRCGGWPRSAFDVLLRLDGEPSAAERERLREDFEGLVRQPMLALIHDLADADPAYEDFSVFSFGKMVWHWRNQPAVLRIRKYLELSVVLDLDGLKVEGAWWFADRSQIERYRRAVDTTVSGERLAAIVDTLRRQRFQVTGDVMKRVPRGYSTDHDRAELLRHRSLRVARPLGDGAWLHTPRVVERVSAAFDNLRPMISWFIAHVSTGPPEPRH